MGKIEKIIKKGSVEGQTTEIYPITSTKAIYDENNKRLDKILEASQAKLSELESEVSQLGQYVDNPEWVRVVTDANDRILYGVKTDGKFYFGDGCPPQVQEYVAAQLGSFNIEDYDDIKTFLGSLIDGDTLATLLNAKVDKEPDKSLVDAIVAESINYIQNPEWIEVKTDSEDKILEGITNDGTKVENLPVETPSARVESLTNPEWIQVTTDAEGKILEGITSEGKKKVMVDVEYPNGIPSDIKKYVGKDSHIIHIGDFQGANYEEVQDALNTIDDDTPSNPYTFIIHPKGTAYAPFTMIRKSFEVAYPWTDVVPRNISIIGLDKEHCLFHSDKGDYNFPAAELLTNGIIKNLRFKLSHENYTAGNKSGGYAAHIDCATKDDVGYRMVIEDCDFESSTGPGVGISTHSNGHLFFRRCNFLNIANPGYSPVEGYTNMANHGAVLMHTSVYQTAVNQEFTLEDCIIKSTLGHKSLFISLPNNASTTCVISFFKNICWSESENNVATDIDTRLTYNPMSFGNNFNV